MNRAFFPVVTSFFVAVLALSSVAHAADAPKAGPAKADPAKGEALYTNGDAARNITACVSCHGWTGESPISPFATLTGARAANDPTATNVAQIVLWGTMRHNPPDALSMPAFGNAYSDDEIAAVANYVTARFGSKGSKLTAKDVAELREQTSQ